ncbi:MAG: rubredoxin [Bacilli bacterium]
MGKYVCAVCGYVYDEEVTEKKFAKLADDFTCPVCMATKDAFELKKEVTKNDDIEEDLDELKELSFGQMSILCSNLAKGVEKQYKAEAAVLFHKLSSQFKEKAGVIKTEDILEVEALLQEDLAEYDEAKNIATKKGDRGALRALVWSEKVSKMVRSILNRYNKKGDSILDDTNIYVCEICGFIYIGNNLPKICPVCKVPSFKMTKVEG